MIFYMGFTDRRLISEAEALEGRGRSKYLK